jgi:hypothetical protein
VAALAGASAWCVGRYSVLSIAVLEQSEQQMRDDLKDFEGMVLPIDSHSAANRRDTRSWTNEVASHACG